MSTSELEDLRSLLRSHNGDLEKLKKVMSKVTANVYLGKDMSPLFPDIVLQVQVKEGSIKRLIGMYAAQYAHLHQDTALLCVNQLTKEALHDTDPVNRGHALQTLGSLCIPSLAEYIAGPMKHALSDSSVYVRRLAIGGCLKVFSLSKEVFEEQLLFQHLEELVSDFDNRVIVLAITALTQVRPGYSLKHHTAYKLLGRLNDFTDWQVPLVLSAVDVENLTRSDGEVMDVLNMVDQYLDDCSSSVVLHVVKLLQRLIATMEGGEIGAQLVERVRAPLLFRVKHSTPEVSYWFCLEIPQIITDMTLLSSQYAVFFPEYYDPTYLKTEKIRVLTMVVSKGNVKSVVKELLECLDSPKHSDIAQDLVECVTFCVLHHGEQMSSLILQLATLLKSPSGPLISTVLPCIERIVASVADTAPVVLPLLQRCAEFDLSPGANIALLAMLGQHGEILPECVSMLFCYAEEYDRLGGDVRTALLTACVQQLDLPGMGGILAGLLAKIAQDEDPILRSRAGVYCNLALKGKRACLRGGRERVRVGASERTRFENYPVRKRPPVKKQEDVKKEEVEKAKEEVEGGVEVGSVAEAVDLLGISVAEQKENAPPVQPSTGNDLDDIFGFTSAPVGPPPAVVVPERDPAPAAVPINDDLSGIFGPAPTLPAPTPPPAPSKEIASIRNFLATLRCTPLKPDAYEASWGASWPSARYKTHLNRTAISVSSDLSALFLRHGISTMATTPPHVEPRQVFLHTASGANLALIKLVMGVVDNSLAVEVRAENSMVGEMVLKGVRVIVGDLR